MWVHDINGRATTSAQSRCDGAGARTRRIDALEAATPATDAAKRAPAPGPLAQNGNQRHTIDPLVGGRAAAAEVAVEVQRVQQRCRGGGGDDRGHVAAHYHARGRVRGADVPEVGRCSYTGTAGRAGGRRQRRRGQRT